MHGLFEDIKLCWDAKPVAGTLLI